MTVVRFSDRVQETTTTTGTGDITLAGAATGYQAFDTDFDTGDSVYYTIAGTSEWETGIGTFTSPSTLTRTTVLESSNSNALVSFSAGSKNVFNSIAADFVNQTPTLGEAFALAVGNILP